MYGSYTRTGAALILLAGLALGGCGDGSRTAAPQQPPVISGLTLATVAPVDLPEILDVVGSVRARTSALVSARIPGTVSMLRAREGERVQRGQLLGQLESQENVAQATGALAAVDEAKRGLEEAQARKKLADATFARFKKLYDEEALTRQEFETRQTEQELAHQAVARAEARLRQVQEAGRAIGAVADYTRIIAPISGVIVAKPTDLGATVFPGQPLFTIEDESSYQLELAVPESYAKTVRPGMPVQVTIDALDRTLNSSISEVVPASDPASRTFVAKVVLPVQGVRSGMFGRGSIRQTSVTKGIVVPRSAVFERGVLTAVWAVDANDSVRMRLIKTGRLFGDRVEILAGLAAGDRIVVAGMERAVDGGRMQAAPGGKP